MSHGLDDGDCPALSDSNEQSAEAVLPSSGNWNTLARSQLDILQSLVAAHTALIFSRRGAKTSARAVLDRDRQPQAESSDAVCLQVQVAATLASPLQSARATEYWQSFA